MDKVVYPTTQELSPGQAGRKRPQGLMEDHQGCGQAVQEASEVQTLRVGTGGPAMSGAPSPRPTGCLPFLSPATGRRRCEAPSSLRAESSEGPRRALLSENGALMAMAMTVRAPVRGRRRCFLGKSKVGAVIAAVGRSERLREGLTSRDGTG